MDPRHGDLQNQIEALKNKTEQNRQMAKDAREAANSALKNTTDTKKVRPLKTDFNSWPCSIDPVTMKHFFSQELEVVIEQFELLKQKNGNQAVQSEAEERLKNIVEEAKKMKSQVEDKFRQIQGSINTFICMFELVASFIMSVTLETRKETVGHTAVLSAACDLVQNAVYLCLFSLVRTGGENPTTYQG